MKKKICISVALAALVLCGAFALFIAGDKENVVEANAVAEKPLTEEKITENDAEKMIEDCDTPDEIAELFSQEKFLTAFKEEYNASVEEEGTDEFFGGTNVEFYRDVIIYPEESEGVYIDFDGDNGYLIINSYKEAVAFEIKGDYPQYRGAEYEETELLYSIYDGFVYEGSNGELLPLEKEILTEELWNEYSDILVERAKPLKTFKGGDGEIIDPEEYVKNKYGKGFSLYQSKHLSGYDYVTQNSLSVYFHKDQYGRLYGEGNCALSSVYSLLNYLQDCGKYKKLPENYQTVTHRAASDRFYNKYLKRGYIIENPKILPKLYNTVRSIACKNYGYEVSGTNPFVIDKIIEKTAKRYNTDVNATHVVLWSFDSMVKKEVDLGYPVIWNTANSKTYGSHTTVVTGYRVYRKQKKIFGIKISEYVQFAELNDNWHSFAVYFDFGGYNGVGSFVKVR